MQIKFSEFYGKVFCSFGWPTENAQLLNVFPSNFRDLPPAFVEYDTDHGKYTLPKSGECLVLLFRRKEDGQVFTTVRSRWGRFGDKLDYYTQGIGKMFTVLYEKEWLPK